MATISLDSPPLTTMPGAADAAGVGRQRVRAIVWLTLIFWGSNVLFLTLGTALARNPHLAAIATARVLASFFGLLLCFLIHLLLNRPFLSTTRKRFIALALVAPIAAEAFAWATYFAEAAADPALRQRFSWAGAVRIIAFWTWFFLAWSGLYLALSYSFDIREEQRRAAEIREREHAARLRALHTQINPHFLFNSLNSLSALILDGRTADAEQMVVKLSSFLRMGLAADPKDRIPLAAEMQLQRLYLELEQIRYDDLKTHFTVPKDLESALVPALILQPLVENAVRYGVAGAPPPASISLKAWSEAGRLILEVTDSGKGKEHKSGGSGIGLANVIQRLQLLYGAGQVELTTGRLPDGKYMSKLALPLARQ